MRDAAPLAEASLPAGMSPGGLRVLAVVARHDAAGLAAFAALRAQTGVAAFLLTGTLRDSGEPAAPLGAPLHQPWGEGAYALEAEGCDPLGHRGIHAGLPLRFQALLGMLRPDIVDFHGVPWFGMDALAQARRVLPAAWVVLTLDAPAALDAGIAPPPAPPWMADPVPAPTPSHPPNEAFLRDAFLRRFIADADRIVLRGTRLAEACAAWGLPRERLVVIPAGPAPPAAPPGPPPPARRRLVLGCFADALDAEGVAVLRAAETALRAMPPASRAIRIELHLAAGAGATLPGGWMPAEASPLVICPPVPGRGTDAAMQDCHAVLVPGASRADAPASVARALANRRPVICADAGGAAALLRDGLDGFHFGAGNGVALADLLADLAEAPERLAGLHATLAAPPCLADSVAATLDLFRRLAAGQG